MFSVESKNNSYSGEQVKDFNLGKNSLFPTFSTNKKRSSFPATLPTTVLRRVIFNSPVSAHSIPKNGFKSN